MVVEICCIYYECWDGVGYFNGIVGEDIFIVGCIIVLVDVFDVLGLRCCYKEFWSIDRIKVIFEEEWGKYFEFKLVDLLFNNFDDFWKIREVFLDVGEE